MNVLFKLCYYAITQGLLVLGLVTRGVARFLPFLIKINVGLLEFLYKLLFFFHLLSVCSFQYWLPFW